MSEYEVGNRIGEREKHYYANNNSFSKQNARFPPEFENRIICANSLEILKQLPDNCVDIIFTSPPYNFGRDYDEYNDTIKWKKYYETLFAIFK